MPADSHFPTKGTLALILPIVVALGYFIYLLKDRPAMVIQSQECTIKNQREAMDSMQSRIASIEPLRDTIIQEVVRTKVKWKERLVEAYTKPDTILVPSYIPIRLDSCQEVGALLEEQVALTDSLLVAYRVKDSICRDALNTLDSVVAGQKALVQKEQKKVRRNRVVAVAVGSAVLGATLLK